MSSRPNGYRQSDDDGQYFDPRAAHGHAAIGELDEYEDNMTAPRHVERFFTYPFEVTLGASATLLNQRIVVNGDAPFVIKQLTRTKTGDFKIRLHDNEGRYYSSAGEGGGNDRVRDACIFGDGSLPFILVPPITIPPSGSISFDLEDVSGAPNTVHLCFVGAKLYAPAP